MIYLDASQDFGIKFFILIFLTQDKSNYIFKNMTAGLSIDRSCHPLTLVIRREILSLCAQALRLILDTIIY